jgi:hypothetical protein
MDALEQAVAARRTRCQESKVTDLQLALDGEALRVSTPQGTADMTHWSFGQLCRLGGAPSDYLRSLPPFLAAPSLQWSLEARAAKGRDPIKALVARDNATGALECRALTSPTYGRIWDVEVVRAMQRLGSDWHVPAASYSDSDPLRATTLYASDRDVFMFLCRQEAVELGGGQALNRGIMAWNSEVGSAAFGLATFTYDRVCDNRIIWGMQDCKEIRIRHTSGAPARMLSEVMPKLRAYAQSETKQLVATVQAAKACEVGKDRESVEAWMAKRGFTKSQAASAYESAERDARRQGLNPRSVWGLVQGATDVAHAISHTDARVAVERAAGKLLESVAA